MVEVPASLCLFGRDFHSISRRADGRAGDEDPTRAFVIRSGRSGYPRADLLVVQDFPVAQIQKRRILGGVGYYPTCINLVVSSRDFGRFAELANYVHGTIRANSSMGVKLKNRTPAQPNRGSPFTHEPESHGWPTPPSSR